jgi:ABC-type Fe3+/spermidine/putrescine transport system ATPase subunit
LLGPTGAGKTLVIRTILGFHKPDEGKIVLNGRDITDEPPEKRGLGYVPQNQSLFPHMTVRQNIGFGLRIRDISEVERNCLIDDMLDLLNLNEFEDRFPSTLSGGERQKVALGRALVLKPQVILLDEPLSNIDAESRRRLRRELKRLHRELNLTIVHVTHDQMEAFELASTIAIMRNGMVAQVGSAKEVFENPLDEYTARFLGYENIFIAENIGKENGFTKLKVEGILLKTDLEIKNSEVKIAIRNDRVNILQMQPSGETSNVYKGTLQDYVDLGPFVTMTVDIGVFIKADLSKSEFMDLGFVDDEDVWINFDPNSIMILK